MKILQYIKTTTLFTVLNHHKESIVIILLLLSNFYTKFIYYQQYNTVLTFFPSTWIKGFILFAVILSFILLKDKQKMTYYILLISSVFLIEFLIHKGYENSVSIGSRIYYFAKYVFLFFLIPVVNAISVKKLNSIINILIGFALLNIIFIVLGFLFDINIFKSYPNTIRYGYNGLLPIQGAGSFFYIFTLSVVYYRYYVEYKSEQKVSAYTYLQLGAMLIGSILVGTKAIILFMLLLAFIDVYFRLGKRILVISSMIISGILFFVFLDPIIFAMLRFFNLHESLYLDNSLWTFLTSKRDILLEQAIKYINENWDIVNYIFGGIDFGQIRVEFEIVDLFLFFGIAGIIIYTLFFKKMFYAKNHIVYNVLLSVAILISFLSGNLMSSMTNSLFFCITFIYLKRFEKTTDQ